MKTYLDLKVPVERNILNERLRANLSHHKACYDDAILGYRAELAKSLRDQAQRVEAGDSLMTCVKMPAAKPESHVEDYERALDMLALCQSETVELSCDDFKRLVNDQWEWSEEFSSSSSSYSSSGHASFSQPG